MQDTCRETLGQAHCRYSEDRTAETRAAYLNALKISLISWYDASRRIPSSCAAWEGAPPGMKSSNTRGPACNTSFAVPLGRHAWSQKSVKISDTSISMDKRV